jgi:hypothetical protein
MFPQCVFCLARCGFILLPSFRWDALWGIYSDATLLVNVCPFLSKELTQTEGDARLPSVEIGTLQLSDERICGETKWSDKQLD